MNNSLLLFPVNIILYLVFFFLYSLLDLARLLLSCVLSFYVYYYICMKDENLKIWSVYLPTLLRFNIKTCPSFLSLLFLSAFTISLNRKKKKKRFFHPKKISSLPLSLWVAKKLSYEWTLLRLTGGFIIKKKKEKGKKSFLFRLWCIVSTENMLNAFPVSRRRALL